MIKTVGGPSATNELDLFRQFAIKSHRKSFADLVTFLYPLPLLIPLLDDNENNFFKTQ